MEPCYWKAEGRERLADRSVALRQAEFAILFALVEASAEDAPLPAESFDLTVSEYGASLWCDPRRWLPEAHRLLRPGGRLWFLRNSPLSMLCATAAGLPSKTLQRPQRGLVSRTRAGGR